MLFFFHGKPGFHFTCTSCIFCYQDTQILKTFLILRLFLIYQNLYWKYLAWDSHYLGFLFILFHSFLPLSVPQVHLHISQYELPFSYFKVSNPLTSSLVRYSLNNLNKIGDKQHPRLHNPLSPWSSRNLTLIHVQFADILHSRQSKPVIFRIYITWSSLYGQLPFTSLWGQQTVLHICPQFIPILFLSSQFHP
jgi:hypothetical protein